jgi:hypothetical protein
MLKVHTPIFVAAFRPLRPGLPDGLFSNPKSKFGKILEGLAMEDVGILFGYLVHFTVFCYILWTFGIVRGNLVYFFRFGIFSQEKSGNPGGGPVYIVWQIIGKKMIAQQAWHLRTLLTAQKLMKWMDGRHRYLRPISRINPWKSTKKIMGSVPKVHIHKWTKTIHF